MRHYLEMVLLVGLLFPGSSMAGELGESGSISWDEAQKFWSFQSPTRHPAPAVKRPDWGRRSIDAFILGKVEASGLSPSEPADDRTWFRRVTFDLTGLPPTPEEIDSFVNDPSPDAYESLVDRLLKSERFGERWAQP